MSQKLFQQEASAAFLKSKKEYADGSMLEGILNGVANVANSSANIVSAANNKSYTETHNNNSIFTLKNSTGIAVAVMAGVVAVVVIVVIAKRK